MQTTSGDYSRTIRRGVRGMFESPLDRPAMTMTPSRTIEKSKTEEQ